MTFIVWANLENKREYKSQMNPFYRFLVNVYYFNCTNCELQFSFLQLLESLLLFSDKRTAHKPYWFMGGNVLKL